MSIDLMDDDDFADEVLTARRGRFEPGARLQKHWFKDLDTYRYENIPEPKGNHVLIAVEEGREKVGSIIVPEHYRGTRAVGQVVACGPGAFDPKHGILPCTVVVGDRVAFKDTMGMSIVVGPAICRLIKEDFILGKVVDSTALPHLSEDY
jgi:co-chaperonin GroES (HSP10)